MTAKTASAEAVSSPLYTLEQVCERTTLGKSSVYQLIAEGKFPRPIRLKPHASRWERIAVDAWLDSRIREHTEGREPYSTAPEPEAA